MSREKNEMEVRLERLDTMRAAHVHAFSENPEEDAWEIIETWARPKGLLEDNVCSRIFVRNTYPTNKPEPHGYEFFLTVEHGIESEGDIDIREIFSGFYAVLRFKGLEKIGED